MIENREFEPAACALFVVLLSVVSAPSARATVTSQAMRKPIKRNAPEVLIMRGLDKMTGQSAEIVAPVGVPVPFATLRITARYCHSTPPSDIPETVAFLQIDDDRPEQAPKRVFSGWMYASSPSLNALDHPLYDVWVGACRSKGPHEIAGAVASLLPHMVKPPDSTDREGLLPVPKEAGQ